VHVVGKTSAISSSASTLIRRCNRLLPPPLPIPGLLVRGDELETNPIFVHIADPRKCEKTMGQHESWPQPIHHSDSHHVNGMHLENVIN
jgi:hypothetical protein